MSFRNWREWRAAPLIWLGILGTLWLVLMAFSGCAARETNKSLQQSDQAQEAAQQVLAHIVAPLMAALDPETHAKVRAALDQVCALITSARMSIRPAMTLTAGNEPPPPVDTTVEEAVTNPQQFIAKAAQQSGRAAVEVERIGWWRQVGEVVMRYGLALSGSLFSQVLTATGTGGLAAAALMLWRQTKTLRTALGDSVAFGNETAMARPEEVPAIVKRHKERQKHNGTKATIDKAGAAVTAATP